MSDRRGLQLPRGRRRVTSLGSQQKTLSIMGVYIKEGVSHIKCSAIYLSIILLMRRATPAVAYGAFIHSGDELKFPCYASTI